MYSGNAGLEHNLKRLSCTQAFDGLLYRCSVTPTKMLWAV
ncbi:hypothetical protein IQ26_05389 [Mesorhizobium tianshanense]|uniref:Uncharacterized protein n=1 Tax=Mesorhizobium tianshanense TaxID=39844 RepID=A0A562N895_9HYPH|nr:hypothetical protein IQ26_05389 [Mesorhizobium tianshanense]